jgi:hypothetical protein
MPALTPQELATLGGCFDCMEPGLQQTMIITLLQQIQAASPGAPLTTTSLGGLRTATATSAVNAARKKFTLQNQKNEELFVKFGTGATTSDYHIVLPSHNTGSKHSDPLMLDGYIGAISVAATAGSPSYTFAEFV